MSIVSVSSVRVAGGFPSDLISDSDIESCLSVVEDYAERSMNTFFVPVKRLETFDGTNTEFFYCLKNPVLRVDYLESYGNVLDLGGVEVSRESGRVRLKSSANISRFYGKQSGVKIVYWTAFLVPSKEFSVVSGDVSAGLSAVISVDDVSDLVEGDWVHISSNSGVWTSAKITNITGTDVTVDNLVIDIVSGSSVFKLSVPEYVKRLIELEAVIYLSLNAIGATYVFNASYSLGDLNVTKGVPYTHWRESLEKAIKERATLKSIIKPRFKIM
jgi:hypothetical protein